MNSILQAVGQLITHVVQIVPQYLNLFFVYGADPGGQRALHIVRVTPIGLFCFVLPLVGLGVGIIRRLVKIRA